MTLGRLLVRFGLTVILVFSLAAMSYAQTGKISGQVVDSESGQPLPGVNVILEGTDQGAATDADGYYTIVNVSPGNYTVSASFIGYAETRVQNVRVNIDLTTTVNFELQAEAIAGQEVVVEASAPVVQPDISGSEQNIGSLEVQAGRNQDINNVLVSNVSINSVDQWEQRPRIRGSDISESKFIVDGVTLGDPLTNRPNYNVNLNAVQEIKVQTGGFSAQYGDLRSGIVNVVTKEGGPTYSGSVDFQYSAPGLKHFGPMTTGFKSPVVVPMVDPMAGAFSGFHMNEDGSYKMDEEGNRIPNLIFEGWDSLAVQRLSPGDPHYGDPMALYARYLWRHRSQDAIDELKRLQREGLVDLEFIGDPDDHVFHQVGIRPDWNRRLTFGGPVPFTNNRINFFLSHNGTSTEYASIQTPAKYENRNWSLKLTTNLADNIKLNLLGMYDFASGVDGGGKWVNSWISSNPFRSLDGNSGPWNARKLWYPDCTPPRQSIRMNYNAKLSHTLSSNTFYELRLNYGQTDYSMENPLRETSPLAGSPYGLNTSAEAGGVIEGRIGTEAYADSLAAAGQPGWDNWEDWRRVKIDGYWYDETPKGYEPTNYKDVTDRYPMGSCAFLINDTYSKTYNAEFDFTSQISQLQQIKTGFSITYNTVFQDFFSYDASINGGRVIKSSADDHLTAGIYVQDKLEFQGFIANIGFRGDYRMTSEFPALDFDDVENKENGPYSDYLLPGNTKGADDEGLTEFNTYEVVPLERVSQFVISPRLGISHPISTVGKLFFNYGHMYQWPSAYQTYRLQYNTQAGNRIVNIGNPRLEPPRTIAYEIGYEQNILNAASLRLTGYYKDINNELDNTRYNFLAGGGYNTLRNGHFRDVRGLEAFLELRRGKVPFISGWASYNYMVESGSDYGNFAYFEDPNQQPRQVSPEVSQPDVRPLLKISADFHTPSQFGPKWFGFFSPLADINLNLTYFWKRGEQFTWNPDQIPYVENNARWAPRQHVDLRFSKVLFRTQNNVNASFYIDVTNLFNHKWMTPPFESFYYGNWAWDLHDWWSHEFEDYMNSLDIEVQRDGTLKGDDRPGDYRTSDKKYIDMPAFTPWTFLFKRDIFFGIKFEF